MSKISESPYKSDIDNLIAQGKGSVVIEKFLKEKGEFISRPTINKYIKTRNRALVRAESNELAKVEQGEGEDLRQTLLSGVQDVKKLIQEAIKEGIHISSEKSLRDFFGLLCEFIRLHTQMTGKGQKQDISIILSQLNMKGETIDFAKLREFSRELDGRQRETNEVISLPEENSARQEHQEDSQ